MQHFEALVKVQPHSDQRKSLKRDKVPIALPKLKSIEVTQLPKSTAAKKPEPKAKPPQRLQSAAKKPEVVPPPEEPQGKKYHNEQYTYEKLRSLKWFSEHQLIPQQPQPESNT